MHHPPDNGSRTGGWSEAIDRSSRPNPLTMALQGCRAGFLAVVAFGLVINLLFLTAPLYMLQVFDRVLTSRSVETLLYLTLIAVFAFLVLWCLDVLRGRLMISLGNWFDERISGDVLAASLAATSERQRASIQPLRDVSMVRNFVTGPGLFPILDVPWTPVFLAVVFLLHPILGWIGLAGTIILFALAVLNGFATSRLLQSAGETSSRALDEAQSAVRNTDAIEAMGMMSQLISRWMRASRRSLEEQARSSRRNGLITATSKFFRQVLQISVLGVGAWLVLGGELSPGGMIAGSILMARALAPVEQAIASWRSAIAARSALRRIARILTVSGRPAPPTPLPEPKGRLTLEGVCYAHQGDKAPMLRNIDFELQPGESLGLIGPTAAGKTTLARIIIGILKPQMGHARLDGADLAAWDARDRGRHIGYLPQDIELFHGTVRENIARLGEGDIEQVYEAAQIAGVHEDILALPNGYDTEIGVGGMTLSGGQRQKFGLARAAYGEPKLVVLDEPNSNLDLAGEAALLEAISHLRDKGTTIVIVAHRPSVLRTVDKILVLREGGIEMMGPRDEILTHVQIRPGSGTREQPAQQSSVVPA